jgi:hypothetical protein
MRFARARTIDCGLHILPTEFAFGVAQCHHGCHHAETAPWSDANSDGPTTVR